VWVLAFVACVAAGCGRSGFCEGPGATPDAGIDAAPNANVVFVTSTKLPQTFGADFSGADSICMQRAAAANLPGTFVAFLSNDTTRAVDRLAGSRGWVRRDGVPVVDAPADLFLGKILNPIILDENGLMVVPGTAVWTGTDSLGDALGTCSNWQDATAAASATYGTAGDGYPFFTASASDFLCDGVAALYCFEIGHATPVAPAATTAGRVAFLGRPRTSAEVTLGALDNLCQTDATSNGVSGTFLAAVASGTGSVASRFTLDGQPWRRIDGTQIVPSAARLFDSTPLDSFINQTADGTYDNTLGDFITGAPDAYSQRTFNCTDWSYFGNSDVDVIGRGHWLGGERWNAGNNACDGFDYVLCLEQ